MKKQINKICHRWTIKNIKQHQAYLKREEFNIENTPKIIVGRLENNIQQIWTEDLKNQIVLPRLKELNSNQLAYSYARKIILACVKLAPAYGFFIINENMVFFNQKKDIFVWINPQILENNVKIYLPKSQGGELMMVRSIITYLKIWLKCDYGYIADVKHLNQLLMKFDILIFKNTGRLQPTITVKKCVTNENNINHWTQNLNLVQRNAASVLKIYQPYQLTQHRSNRQLCLKKSPSKQCTLAKNFSTRQKLMENQMFSKSSFSSHQRGLKKKTFFFKDYSTDKMADSVEQNFDDKTLNSNHIYKLQVNKSMGITNDSDSFPSHSTSNKHHPIVQLINSQDMNSDYFKSNRLLLDDDKLNEELQRQRLNKMNRMKESLYSFGDEINNLFISNIRVEDGKVADLIKIQQEFGNLFI